jgi:hypothetical protein
MGTLPLDYENEKQEAHDGRFQSNVQALTNCETSSPSP